MYLKVTLLLIELGVCHPMSVDHEKKAIIVIALVKESNNVVNKKVEKEIFDDLSKNPPYIPWFRKVEKVTVIEAQQP